MSKAARDCAQMSDGQVAALHRDYVAGRQNVVDICQGMLEAIALDSNGLNAFCHLDQDATLAMAGASAARYRDGVPLGPMDGIPVTIKDTIHVADWPTRRGSLATPETSAENDAISVRRLRDAGAVFLGKTTTPEHAWKGTTESPLSGITRNPLDPSRSPGGSSGGGAAATADGMGIIALGSDAAGSVRIPAAFTGLVGYKPSFGMIPLDPYPDAFLQLAHLGVMVPTVADAVVSVATMMGSYEADWTSLRTGGRELTEADARPIRFGVVSGAFMGNLTPEVEHLWQGFVAQLQSKEVDLSIIDVDLATGSEIGAVLYRAAVAQAMSGLKNDALTVTDPELLAFIEPVSGWPSSRILDALMARETFTGNILRLLNGKVDVLISPTMAILPPPAVPDERTVPDRAWLDWNPFTPVANIAHLPAFSVPWGALPPGTAVWPIGIQVLAAPGRDAIAARAARMIEGWAQIDNRIQAGNTGIRQPF